MNRWNRGWRDAIHEDAFSQQLEHDKATQLEDVRTRRKEENKMEEQTQEFTHFDAAGNAYMVDVSGKSITSRMAIATGRIQVSKEVFDAILGKKVKKGDVLTVAQVAGIMGTKRTSDLIPMCHILNLTNAKVWFELHEESCSITAFCQVKTEGKTGVEMEALTGVHIALLTIYDMCKAIDKRMVMTDIHLVEKNGGKSGDFLFEEK